MPVQECQDDNRPGFKWGILGKCFTYTDDDESRDKAKQNAVEQGRAIEAEKNS